MTIEHLKELLTPDKFRTIVDNVVRTIKSIIADPFDGSAIVASGPASTLISFAVSSITHLPVVYVRDQYDQRHHGCSVEGDDSHDTDVKRLVYVGYDAPPQHIAHALSRMRSASFYTDGEVPRPDLMACITVVPVDDTQSIVDDNDAPVAFLVAGEVAQEVIPRHFNKQTLPDWIITPSHAAPMFNMHRDDGFLAEVVRGLTNLIRDVGVTSIAVCGKSGLAFAGYLMYTMQLPIFCVLKNEDRPVCSTNVFGHKLVFFDDLIDSGSTLGHVINVATRMMSEVAAVCTYYTPPYLTEERHARTYGQIALGVPHYQI